MSTLTLERALMVAEPASRFLARSPIVVDASMVCAILFDGGLGEQSSRLIADHALYAPYLLDHEIISETLRRFAGPGAAANVALERYRALEIALCDTDVQAQFDLALRYRISAFSAAYLCLAAELHSPLATFDPQLAEAARAHLSSLD